MLVDLIGFRSLGNLLFHCAVTSLPVFLVSIYDWPFHRDNPTFETISVDPELLFDETDVSKAVSELK
jgi:hypothetical protein